MLIDLIWSGLLNGPDPDLVSKCFGPKQSGPNILEIYLEKKYGFFIINNNYVFNFLDFLLLFFILFDL